MSNKPILVLKDIQTLQTVGTSKRPSFMGMLRTAISGKDAEGKPVGRMRRLGNALGVGAKTVAGTGAALQAAHQMQGGNLYSPLQIGQMYEGLDPTGSFSQGYHENFGQGDSVAGRNNTARQFVQQEQARLGPQQITTSTAGPSNSVGNVTVLPPVSGAPASTPPAPQQITTSTTGATGTPSTGTPHQITTPTTAPATTATPQSNATLQTLANDPDAIRRLATAMSGNQPQQTGTIMPTPAPPAGVSDNQIVNTGIAANTAFKQPSDPLVNAGQMNPLPSTDQNARYVQQQLQFRPSGPQGALPPVPGAKPQGPPPAHTSTMHPMPPQQSMVSVLPPMNQSPSAHSTANPLSQSDINYANDVLGQYHNQLPQHQQAYGGGVMTPQQAQGNFNTEQWGQPDPNQRLGSSVNWNQWNTGMPDWMQQKMLKAFISYLYDNMGSYLYKMTPHEAGAFAVDVFLKMRE